MSLKLKRIAPGYYAGTYRATRGRWAGEVFEISVSKVAEISETAWYWEIENHELLYGRVGGDDWFRSKADAVYYLEEYLKTGLEGTV